MLRRTSIALLVGVLAGGVGCADATDESSEQSESESPNDPAPGSAKGDSTTRETNIKGSIEFGKDVHDRYRDEYVGYTFEISGEATVSARVVSGRQDPAVWLYGPQESDGDWGYEIAENDDISWENENAEISGEELDESGKYLVVTGTEDWGSSSGPYTIHVDCSGPGCSGSATTGDGDSDDDGTSPSGDVCGGDASDGDFVSTDDRSIDGFALGDGYVFAGIDEWNGTIESDDDQAKICAYPIEDGGDFGYDESCFLPKQVETTLGNEPIAAMAYESDKLYVAIDAVLFVYDVSSLEDPRLLGEWSTDANPGLVARDMEVRDGIVYIGGHPRILDASNPSQIEQLANFQDSFFNDWTIVDGTAYAVSDTHVRTFDVSDPADPQPLDSFKSSSEPTKFLDVAVASGHLFAVSDSDSVEDDRSGLWVFDVSDPGSIRNVHRSKGAPAEGLEVAVRGGYAVIAKRVAVDYGEYENRVSIFDVSNPAAPSRVEQIDPEGIPREMAFHGGNAFYASFDWGNVTSTDRNGVGSLETACSSY